MQSRAIDKTREADEIGLRYETWLDIPTASVLETRPFYFICSKETFTSTQAIRPSKKKKQVQGVIVSFDRLEKSGDSSRATVYRYTPAECIVTVHVYESIDVVFHYAKISASWCSNSRPWTEKALRPTRSLSARHRHPAMPTALHYNSKSRQWNMI